MEPTNNPIRKLYRDIQNGLLGGVCAGLANYFNVDVVIIRVIFISLAISMGVGFWGYLLMWIMVPANK